MITVGLMSSDSAEHYTPPSFLDLVREVAPIDLDPCWSPKSLVRPRRAYTVAGLTDPWSCDDGLIFVNPPYGRGIGEWVARCARAGVAGHSVLALVPARTDSLWFQSAIQVASAVCFLRGRLRFWTTAQCDSCNKVGLCKKDRHVMRELDAAVEAGPAPFPSVVLFWGRPTISAYFRAIFKNRGWLP